jgi:hypothetical protein
MKLKRSGNLGEDIERTTRDINAVFEAAIRAKPGLGCGCINGGRIEHMR